MRWPIPDALQLLRNAQLLTGGPPVDIGIQAGRIVSLGPGLAAKAGETVWDLEGRVVLPGLVDAHVHLDKTLSLGRGDPPNRSGTLLEAIDRWGAAKAGLTKADYLARAERAVRLASRHGTTAMRTHVDIDQATGLTALEALLELKSKVADVMDLQIVALGQSGVSRRLSDLLRAALDAGADIIGGAPALTPDPDAAVREALLLAEATGKPVDLHIDETDDPTVRTLERLADETYARGLAGRVVAGHCVSLGAMEAAEAAPIIDKVARAGISVVTLPAVNLVLQGRGDMARTRRGLTRAKELLAAGVRVAAASDNVQDPFNPFGNYDLVWLANLCAHAAHLTGTEERAAAWTLVTLAPAALLGRPGTIEVGAEADLVVLEHHDPATCLAALPPRYAVLKRGVPLPLEG